MDDTNVSASSGEEPRCPRMRRRYFYLALVAALAVGWAMGRNTAPVHGMEVTFHNRSEVPVESIKLDFGTADTQSSIQAFRLAPGRKRVLVLNHTPGAGFNVKVRYKGGATQEFCALRSDKQQRPTIELKP
ncbi:hypothetical protein [Marinobacter sp. F3R11]|uniref:hypothetical protein n=1 Tax=Marinobacter sp. F3R11 TaxID=2267231 RepID=UPI000DE8A253|nr:hypothetical protein [Marinobacter sp. F3R11]RBW48477.1 hypothetical protein DS878_09840 [Marinobacter sp. F3R11]